MSNAELFKKVFGIYAEEFWAYPKEKMLDWLTSNVPETNVGDMISRQAAIDAIDNENPGVAWLDYAVDVIKALPSAQPEPRWIPVEDELPKEGERVLVTDIDGTIEIANYIEYASDDGGIEWWAHDYQCYPIAWRELPKPYERSEE